MQFVQNRWVARVVIAGVLALLMASCQAANNGSLGSPMAFRVGANTVTVADFEQRLETELGPGIAQLIAQGQTTEQITELATQQNVQQAIFENMVQEQLLTQAAREEGLGVDADAVDAAVQEQLAAAQQSGQEIDETELRANVAREQLITQVIAEHTRADMFKARHILVTDEATADDVISQLGTGGDFAALATQFSQDPGSAQNGGELGWVTRGDFVPEFENAAFDPATPLNEPIKVQTQFGWHVIEIEDRGEDRAFESFSDLQRSQSAQQYYSETFIPWYEELRAKAEESGDLMINEEFEPTSVALPFPSTVAQPAEPTSEQPAPTEGD